MAENLFVCKSSIITGTDYAEITKKARRLFHDIEGKRQPAVKSAYFHKDKIFINPFWDHLKSKRRRDRTRRLKLYPCALELIQKSRVEPEIIYKSKTETKYRFHGEAAGGQKFSIQIREELKSGRKYFTSVFPAT